ncbi:bromodomain-containing protein 4B-like [Schistocerca serialis cubense]|uniref:bromodomain-containing protein 4B-like n=1 Tax=Schistocerca serialis cubense TaxID=2023355 RepID=UPI00214F17D0|nr:bromodomain-containing protein 4B-like [Schistocerca serialis cubense]
MASPHSPDVLSEFYRLQNQQTQALLDALGQLVQGQRTIQSDAAAAASPLPQPQPAVAPPFRHYDPNHETWQEWSRQFAFHLAAYRIQATVPSGQRPGDPSTGSPHPQVLPTMPSILPHGDAPPPPQQQQQQQQPPPPPTAFDASLQPPSASQGHAPPIASRDQLSSAMELQPAPDHMTSSRVGYPDAMEVDTLAPPVSLRAHAPHVDVHPGLVLQAFPSSPRTGWPGAGGTASPVVRLPTSSHTSTCGPPHGGRKPYYTTVRRFAGEECGVTARHHTC